MGVNNQYNKKADSYESAFILTILSGNLVFQNIEV
jgi:hypothetical protein